MVSRSALYSSQCSFHFVSFVCLLRIVPLRVLLLIDSFKVIE